MTVVPVGDPFRFDLAVEAHGWPDLAPFDWDPDAGRLTRTHRLSTGRVVRLDMRATESGVGVRILEVPSSGDLVDSPESDVLGADLTDSERAEATGDVRRMVRAEEELAAFADRCRSAGGRWAQITPGAGRILRSPTVFEDLVKTICTTNVQWSGTVRMVRDLVDVYGPGFPSPERIAAVDVREFEASVGLGYRAAYVHDAARRIAEGELDPERWLDSELPVDELRARVLSVRGIGPYAAATLMMLLGRYDRLPVDSVFRTFVGERYFEGADPEPERARSVYESWGPWRYLAYWSELAGWVPAPEGSA